MGPKRPTCGQLTSPLSLCSQVAEYMRQGALCLVVNNLSKVALPHFGDVATEAIRSARRTNVRLFKAVDGGVHIQVPRRLVGNRAPGRQLASLMRGGF